MRIQSQIRSTPRIVIVQLMLFAMVATAFASPITRADSSVCQPLDPIEGTGRRELSAGLELLVQTVSACKTAAQFQTMSTMVTEDYLGQVYGGGPRMSRQTFLAVAVGLLSPPIRFRDFDDLVLIDDRRARANVKLVVGAQLTFEQLYFLEERGHPGVWLIDKIEPLRVTPPRTHTDIEVTIAGDFYDPAAITAGGTTFNLIVANNDAEDHELLLLQMPVGATPGAILIETGPGLPVGFVYLAQITIPAGERGNLVLVGMKPGIYLIVDLLPNENGVPHLALGMQATLTITP